MTKPVEGVLASYVGPDHGPVRHGDRCLIISDEGATMHVRWTTGAARDSFDALTPRTLVADIAHTASVEEFGFEPGNGHRDMVINVHGVYDRGGEVALFEAMESEGHLEALRVAAMDAVKDIRRVIANDVAWDEVRRVLGSDSGDVERSAIIAAVIAAAESDDEMSTEWSDDDEFD